MSKLPDPRGFTNHKTSYIASRPKESDKKSYDLQKIHDTAIKDKKAQSDIFLQAIPDSELVGQINPTKLLYELIDLSIIQNAVSIDWFRDLLGYSPKDKSLTLSLKDKKGVVQTVAVRSSIDRDGNPVKWKTFGSKKFIPYKIEDDFIFLFSGMAEIILMEVFGLSYIQLQADSMVRHLPEELKELTEGKTIIVLQDNDSSFRNIVPPIKSFFKRSEVLVIDFERVLNRELKHGYDFRDFCNEIKDAKKVMERLEIEIVCLQDNSHVR